MLKGSSDVTFHSIKYQIPADMEDRLGFRLNFTHYSEYEYTQFLNDYTEIKNHRAQYWTPFLGGAPLPPKNTKSILGQCNI